MKSNDDIEFKYFFWGPLLFKAKIDKKITDKLLKAGRKATVTAVPDLAGIIEKELYFPENTIKWFEPTIFKITKGYIKHFTETWTTQRAAGVDIKSIKLDKLWINFMRENEYNPRHTHNNCHLSFVLILKMPKLQKERKKYIGNSSGPGAIEFYYGEPNWFVNNGQSFVPEVGDLYMFPWNLTHVVVPYKTKGERISVSGNLSLHGSNGRRLYL